MGEVVRSGLPVLAIITLVGCASGPPAGSTSAPVKVATAEQVSSCTYVDDFVGTSGLYGVFASQGIENARADVLRQAATAGATHLVWGSPVPGHGSTGAAAKAYRCAS